MEQINWENIKEKDRVRLKFTGYHRVPMWLNHSWAIVLRRNKRGNLVVQAVGEAEGYTRTIQPMDIVSHEPYVENTNKETL